MSEPTANEVETLLKSEGGRQGRERIGVVVVTAGIMTGSVTLLLGDMGAFPEDGLRYGWWAAFALLFAGLFTSLLSQRGRARRRLNALIGRRDRLQRKRNDHIYTSSVTGWMMVAITLTPLWRISQGHLDPGDIGYVVGATLSPWLVVMSVNGWNGLASLNRRWLEDEVTLEIRRRALSLGFVVLMLATTALFFVSLWDRSWAMLAFPTVLMAAASITGLRFVWLDQQAEGGEGG
jgi:hypothetical protein